MGLEPDDLSPDLFWYNPNIHPYTEYSARRNSLAAFAAACKLNLFTEDEYGLRRFIQQQDDLRCQFCYRIRLEKTALFALEKGYDCFSTTLLTSPHQKHELIRQIGEEVSGLHKINFFYRDFRPWFREGRQRAREQGSYMQKYCGCIFSEEERYTGK